MKKYVLFILCCFLALSTGKVMANSGKTAETNSLSNKVAYSVNLGNITNLSVETLNKEIDGAFTNIPMSSETLEPARCSVTATVSVGVVSLAITIEADCDKIVEAAKKAIAEVKKLAMEELAE